jgi:hypothetical protein
MTKRILEADYLIVGSGAMGMAFTDVLLTETDASVVMLDRHAQPGGHWNDAYPFVRLHQPSAFYGVNSKPLGSDKVDATGWNRGLYELATGSEIVAYFDQVMQQQFLPSGRVQYFPMCEYHGGSPKGRREPPSSSTAPLEAYRGGCFVPSRAAGSGETDARRLHLRGGWSNSGSRTGATRCRTSWTSSTKLAASIRICSPS